MQLKIKALSYKGQALEAPPSAIFDRQGGSIGLRTDNQLVLPDPDRFISRKHAVISFKNGFYNLTDDSTEGTFITNKNQHLHHNTVQLADGDELRIGDYELIVSIFPVHSGKVQKTSENSDPIELLKNSDPEGEQPSIKHDFKNIENIPESFHWDDSEPIHLLKTPENAETDQPTTGSGVAQTNSVTEDLHKAYKDLFLIFLEGAGIHDQNNIQEDKIPELMRTAGTVFRELIDGLITLLKGRADLKKEFRVPMTVFAPTENNPLKKFSQSIDETIQQLFTQQNPEYVKAVDAVRQGYGDVKNHHLAIIAGIKSSLLAVVRGFDPEKLWRQHGAGVVFQKNAKCWEMYKQSYPQIAKEALDNLFGEEFAREYADQIRKLSSRSSKS